ncbi:hypothetical protein D3C78_1706010 [compost metagenome]
MIPARVFDKLPTMLLVGTAGSTLGSNLRLAGVANGVPLENTRSWVFCATLVSSMIAMPPAPY